MAPTAQDDLLAELNGAAGTPIMTTVDPLPAADPALTVDPLEVKPKPAPSTAIAKSDARHATVHGGNGYKVTVAGEYFASSKDTNQKIRKNYELSFNMPSLDGVLGVIVAKLLLPALKKKYEDCVNYRTHDIVSAVPLSATTPESKNLAFMPRPGLEAYVCENSVPLNAEEYPNTVDLRAAVIDYTLNPAGFEAREKIKQQDRRETAELAAMNPDIL